MRSLTLQLVTRLLDLDPDMARWGLDFVDEWEVVQELELHDLQALSGALHALLRQLPHGVVVYCILDSAARFDVDRLFADWEFVLGFLGAVVEDGELGSVVKVLLTNPGRSTLRVRSMDVFREVPSRLVSLLVEAVDPMEISTRGVEGRLRLLGGPGLMVKSRGGDMTVRREQLYDDDEDYE